MWRNILFIFITTLLLFGLAELVIGYAYFQKNGRYPLSTMELAHYVSGKVSRKRAELYIEDVKKQMGGKNLEWNAISGALAGHLFSEEGADLLDDFAARYEKNFAHLKELTDNVGAKLIVLHIPARREKNYRQWADEYFKNLTSKYGVEYVEMSKQVDNIGYEKMTFEPWNGHLSRYGHYVVAEALTNKLEELADYQSPIKVEAKTTHFTDALPNMRQSVDILPEHTYFVKTNSYGFRTTEEFDLDDPRQKVVFLGDSIIYGPYVANEDTVSDMLQRKYPDRLFLNAAAAGYNIVHQAEMFEEKTQYVGPDIVILQVSGQDIYSMFYYKINEFDRHGRLNEPTPVEEKHVRQVISDLNAAKSAGEN